MKSLAAILPLMGLLAASAGSEAGEIIVGPDRGDYRPLEASSQKDRAAAYQRQTEPAAADEEKGFLTPRGGAPAEERAFDSRMRARAYQQGGDSSALLMQAAPADTPAMAVPEQARDLKVRARMYNGTGNAKDIDLSHVGADGIPIVPCRGDVDNVAARIGDGGTSGNLFYIMRGGKPVKVRCK